MSSGKLRRVQFHPLFRITLSQKILHGELKEAIAMAGTEFRIAKEKMKATGSSDVDGDGTGAGSSDGVILVPAPGRAIGLGYK